MADIIVDKDKTEKGLVERRIWEKGALRTAIKTRVREMKGRFLVMGPRLAKLRSRMDSLTDFKNYALRGVIHFDKFGNPHLTVGLEHKGFVYYEACGEEWSREVDDTLNIYSFDGSTIWGYVCTWAHPKTLCIRPVLSADGKIGEYDIIGLGLTLENLTFTKRQIGKTKFADAFLNVNPNTLKLIIFMALAVGVGGLAIGLFIGAKFSGVVVS